MEINFSKYHGTGNDFVIIDNRTLFFDKTNQQLIHQICERRFGVGADGLMLLENDEELDFKMVYFNADGRESTMCGNGGRCIVAFAKKIGLFVNDNVQFRAIDGVHYASIKNEKVSLSMNCLVNVEKIEENTYYLNTGSPHVVKIVQKIPKDFVKEAKKIRHNDRFNKEGVNVNYVEEGAANFTRTFERGVENETFSCGTGAVAVGVILKDIHQNNVVEIKTKGGALTIKFENDQVFLEGDTKNVFDAKMTLLN